LSPYGWDATRHIAHPPSAAAYDKAFIEHPDADRALVTSPTPYGAAADLEGIADVCHRREKPLIVDEAWGAHLPFHEDLPAWAMDAGADICVTSIHKMGSGLEQGSVFHLQGNLIDPAELASRADLLGTTSPNVLLYAGIDAWRRQMVQHGHELIGRALELAARTRTAIETIDGFHVNDAADFCGPGLAADFDPLPVVMDIGELGTSGYRAADWLRENHHIDVHLFDHRRISAQLTHADDEQTTARLLTALRGLAGHATGLRDAPRIAVPSRADLRMDQVRLPRDAYFTRHTTVPVTEASGRVAAEMITPYPPGIPVVLPGEPLHGGFTSGAPTNRSVSREETAPVLVQHRTAGGQLGAFLRDRPMAAVVVLHHGCVACCLGGSRQFLPAGKRSRAAAWRNASSASWC
jgi:arginine decarboxylase